MKNMFELTKKAKIPTWLSPISDAHPCGPNLEYDPEYAVLIAKMLPKGEAQYGDFIGTSDMPNWAEIERDCRRMLLRSCDITVLIFLLRCRTRLACAEGLREGLTLLVEALETYPEAIHPQVIIDGELDRAVRANAIAALTDPEGVLADIHEIVLSKNTAMRLQVRDIEYAFAIPHAADALSPDSVKQQLSHLHHKKEPIIQALMETVPLVSRLITWTQKNLGEEAPNLSALERLLGHFNEHNLANTNRLKTMATYQDTTPHAEEGVIYQEAMNSQKNTLPSIEDEETQQPTQTTILTPIVQNTAEGRMIALEHIRQTRAWFETHEPSSPVSVLLRQAEHLVGKTFAEVVLSIPLDLLQQWEKEHVQGYHIKD